MPARQALHPVLDTVRMLSCSSYEARDPGGVGIRRPPPWLQGTSVWRRWRGDVGCGAGLPAKEEVYFE
jgi:hypothetical protein